MAAPVRRRRGDAEETRRRVLDAVVSTVIDVGYYKASSNEIARRAGVTWGSIQHLFGSREQLMLDVVNDFGASLERSFAGGVVEGDTLEVRLRQVFDLLAAHYEKDTYLVQVQILLDLSANPKMSARGRRAIKRNSGQVFDSLARPLLARALGEVAAEHDLVLYAFMTMRGYLVSCAIARLIAEFPEGAVLRLAVVTVADPEGSSNEALSRDLVVRGVAAMVREEASRRGYDVDAAVLRPLREESV
jgi:AcrR family transcriptional regulator